MLGVCTNFFVREAACVGAEGLVGLVFELNVCVLKLYQLPSFIHVELGFA